MITGIAGDVSSGASPIAHGATPVSDAARVALVKVAAAASGASRLEDVLQLAAEEARRVLEAASLSISRWERDEDLIRTLVNVGELGPGERRFPDDETYPVAEYPLVARMLTDRVSYFNDTEDPSCSLAARRVLERLEKASDVGVPIIVGGSVWGELWATRRAGEEPFGDEAARFLEEIAERCAPAIGRAEQFSHVSRLAYEDALTGLPNRRALDDRLSLVCERFSSDGIPAAVILCDLDGLKEINDLSGHHQGDLALRGVASVLREIAAKREGAFAGRLAGDEFCLILANQRAESAAEVWTTMLSELNEASAQRFSLSGGVAETNRALASPTDLLRAADGALYMAKRAGGGRMYIATEKNAVRRASQMSSGPGSIRAATERLTRELDGELLDAPAIERIEAVARAFLDAGGFLVWAISVVPEGWDRLVDLSKGNVDFPTTRVGPGGEQYSLAQFPATAAAIDAGSGSFTVFRSDPAADENERALLERFDRESVIGVVASHGGDTYLLEIYGGEASLPMKAVEIPLRLLMRAAMPPR